jgi:polysaccharide export outer membrane protein
MIRGTVVVLLAVLLSLAGCSPSPTYNWHAENAVGYRIGPGDKIHVSYWAHKEIDTDAVIRPDGAFAMPLINDVQAAGKSADEIAADVAARLKNRMFRDENPSITVQVLEVKSYKVYVLGEVGKPGDYSPSQPVTVLQGLSMAGGFTRFANPDRIIIVRKDARGERRIPFDYSAVVENGDLEQDLVLQLGDTVIVP